MQSGELLWPEKVTAPHLDGLKISLGSYSYAGQYQQPPAPAGGGVLARCCWRYWRPAHLDLPTVQIRMPDGRTRPIAAVPVPAQLDSVIQSWDMAFKDKAGCDYVVGQVWGAKGADRFLLDQVAPAWICPPPRRLCQYVIPALAQGRRQAGGRQSQRAGRDSGTATSCRAINRGHSRRRQTRPRPCRVAPGGSRQHLPSASGYRTVDRRFPGGSGRVFRTGATTIK